MNKTKILYLNLSKNFLVWSCSGCISLLFRFEFDIPSEFIFRVLFGSIVATVLYGLIQKIDRIIFGHATSLTFEEFSSVTRKFLLTGFLLFFMLLIYPSFFLPRSIPILSSILALGITLATDKILKFQITRRNMNFLAEKVIIYGGGEQGQLLIKKILSEKNHEWRPILIFDDFIDKSVKKINGIRVVSGKNLLETLTKYKPRFLIITFAAISNSKLQDVQSMCNDLNIELLIIPPIRSLTGADFTTDELRAPTQEELIGKSSVSSLHKSIRKFIYHKTILISGAGGSIGSELARQINTYSPKKLFLLDRDETALLNTNLSLDNNGSINQEKIILADIRDEEKIKQVFDKIKPEIVFHAAALKHLSILEANPDEAFKTNVVATNFLIQQSVRCNVEVFVNISTDKAADPISVLGVTKLFSERLIRGASLLDNSSRFLSVRFGNVFGSRGSVLHVFKSQIEKGGPITLTAKGVSRFFMTIEEAIHLLLHAASTGKNGQTLILKMGEPIIIENIAKKLIASSKKKIEIQYMGLRPGEKMHEILVGVKEQKSSIENENIISIYVDPFSLEPDIKTWDQLIKYLN